ncbi:MAG: hypothetical protein KHX56_13635 [Clostridiales bacterium]|nr:hypothetical protein [Clostridiales bacterium]
MSPWIIVMIVILVILIGAIIFLTVWGKKQQKKMDENQAQIEANSQNMTMLIIDKKKMPLKAAGLPQVVVDATPKLLRRSKVPVVKAKVGPRIMVLIADDKIYDMIPVKQEVKATVSGIYITKVRSLRGPALVAPPKVGFFKRMKNKVTGKNK